MSQAVYIFQDPYSDIITTAMLLKGVRKTKLHLMEQNETTISFMLGNLTICAVQPTSTPVAVDLKLAAMITLQQRSRNTCKQPKLSLRNMKLKSMQFKPIMQFVHATPHTGGNLFSQHVVVAHVSVFQVKEPFCT